ncbi:MAG: transglutaminase domain-containing protein [Enhydrobacter sp.]|nr:MAG: transglutaminase domain-containing protein [Enhydrobacter sp.]
MKPDFYRQPAALSDPSSQVALFDDLPGDAGALSRIVQGLVIHQHIASSYGIALSQEKHAEVHTRSVEDMLKNIAARDSAPLADARAPGDRQVGVCRHFTLMHVAMLRRKGVAARARCGFAAYFEKGRYLDHWVTEYWDLARERWLLVDAQLDRHQQKLFGIAFDPLDVPRQLFVVAGEAWRRCRDGKADPRQFGILDMYGLWFVAGNVIRDIAALNNHEMLPWDVWGAMPRGDSDVDLELFDRLAVLSGEPDRHFEGLGEAYRDSRVAVPPTVFNAVLGRPQEIAEISAAMA